MTFLRLGAQKCLLTEQIPGGLEARGGSCLVRRAERLRALELLHHLDEHSFLGCQQAHDRGADADDNW
jgi:hypothetical protein